MNRGSLSVSKTVINSAKASSFSRLKRKRGKRSWKRNTTMSKQRSGKWIASTLYTKRSASKRSRRGSIMPLQLS
jgi:hypothetical protein